MTQSLNQIVIGMNPAEKKIYFEHLEENTKWELERLEVEKQQRKSYRQMMIDEIMEKRGDCFKLETLRNYSTKTLERIYDNC